MSFSYRNSRGRIDISIAPNLSVIVPALVSVSATEGMSTNLIGSDELILIVPGWPPAAAETKNTFMVYASCRLNGTNSKSSVPLGAAGVQAVGCKTL